jgi:hypothetical protein
VPKCFYTYDELETAGAQLGSSNRLLQQQPHDRVLDKTFQQAAGAVCQYECQ